MRRRIWDEACEREFNDLYWRFVMAYAAGTLDADPVLLHSLDFLSARLGEQRRLELALHHAFLSGAGNNDPVTVLVGAAVDRRPPEEEKEEERVEKPTRARRKRTTSLGADMSRTSAAVGNDSKDAVRVRMRRKKVVVK